MYRYFIIYKPFNTLTQFSEVPEGTKTLKELSFAFPVDVYPIGRLDKDSEGLLLLTNDKRLNNLLLSPRNAHEREYYVQVEGTPTPQALKKLEQGVQLSDHFTGPAKTKLLKEEPNLPDRNPPIRFRKTVPTSWISLSLTEGKNRQVRRMTAAVGLPTLRLVRWRIGKIELGNMKPGDVVEMEADVFFRKLGITAEQLEERERIRNLKQNRYAKEGKFSGGRSFSSEGKKPYKGNAKNALRGKPFKAEGKKPIKTSPKNSSIEEMIQQSEGKKPYKAGGKNASSGRKFSTADEMKPFRSKNTGERKFAASEGKKPYKGSVKNAFDDEKFSSTEGKKPYKGDVKNASQAGKRTGGKFAASPGKNRNSPGRDSNKPDKFKAKTGKNFHKPR